MTTTRTPKEQARIDKNNLHAARKALLIWQPEAIHIRLEKDKCPFCKRAGGFVSYQLPQDLPGGEWYKERGDGYESCGFYCRACSWSNGGAREVSEE